MVVSLRIFAFKEGRPSKQRRVLGLATCLCCIHRFSRIYRAYNYLLESYTFEFCSYVFGDLLAKVRPSGHYSDFMRWTNSRGYFCRLRI